MNASNVIGKAKPSILELLCGASQIITVILQIYLASIFLKNPEQLFPLYLAISIPIFSVIGFLRMFVIYKPSKFIVITSLASLGTAIIIPIAYASMS